MRVNDVKVDEQPKFDESDAIVVTHQECNIKLIIPLSLQGVTSYFPTRKPMRQEY